MPVATAPQGEPAAIPNGRGALNRPLPAFIVLLAVYATLALANDPDGYLGADTGAKVYTLEVMDRTDTIEPDIGYWAEDLDPDGSLHPIHHTRRRSDGSWVAVTTLPMLVAAAPLYELGGYRAVLVLPMLGGVGAAFAARAISKRIERSDGWPAFWLVGLSSPALIYSLDFWEHTGGLACMLGAVALLLVVLDRGRLRYGVLAGALLGLGSTMRNETLIYAAVTVGVTCAVLLGRRRVASAMGLGMATVAGFTVPWIANVVLERALDGPSRATRATGTASGVAGPSGSLQLGRRLEEGLQTLVGLVSGDPTLSVLLGAGVVAAILLAVRAERHGDSTFAVVALGAAAAVYLADAIGGLGFVPGMLIAFPIAIAGFFLRYLSNNGRIVVAMAVLALPFAYLFQFLGASGPQWGGRYTLTSAILLGVAGLAGLVRQLPLVGRGLLVLTVVVTLLGVAWVGVRSRDVDRFFTALEESAEPVVIARQAFLLREGGAAAVGQRWLSTENEREFVAAVDIARQVGAQRFSVLEWDGDAPPSEALPADVVEVDRTLLYFTRTPVGLVSYTFAGTDRGS